MSTRTQLRDYLFETLIPTKPESRPPDSANLLEFGLDSLRIMQMLVFVEEQMNVMLPDHEITPERVETVDALVEWIESHQTA